jgi:hypothetical protein
MRDAAFLFEGLFLASLIPRNGLGWANGLPYSTYIAQTPLSAVTVFLAPCGTLFC